MIAESGDRDPANRYNLARALHGVGRAREALTAVGRYLGLRPGAVRGYLLRAEIQAAGANWAAAEADLLVADRLASGHSEPGLRLGRLYLAMRPPRLAAAAERHGGWAWADLGTPGCTVFLLALPEGAPHHD